MTKVLLDNTAFRDAMGAAVKTLVIDYLRANVIKNNFIDGVAGRVVQGTVDALLAKPAMVDLIDTIVVNVLSGMPLADVQPLVIHAVLTKPALQFAIGMSLGEGIGSLFGDNLVGFLVGQIVGVTTAIQVSLIAGIVRIFTRAGRPFRGRALPRRPLWSVTTGLRLPGSPMR